MGRVFLARSPGGRMVAVKIVREELAEDPTFRRRFVREVAAARRVTGFFTAAVVDAAPQADPPWLATAYVPGPSLSDAVTAHGPWPEEAVLGLGIALAEALEGIHGADVVHRDLKPSNVLLAHDGPRVIDFGVSVAAEDTKLTLTGTAVGTPGYVPPEQLVGKHVGPAGDVFALGAVLAYAATGTGPFGGGMAHGVNYRVVHEEPDLGRVPPRLAAVVARCLAKDPEQRPSLPELLEELGRFSTAGRFPQGQAGRLPAPVVEEITRMRNTPLPDTVAETPAGAADAVPLTSVATRPLRPERDADRSRPVRRRLALAGVAVAAALAVLAVTLLVRGGNRGDAQAAEPSAPAKHLTLEQVWSYEKDPVDPPAVSDGKVYFGDHDGTLHAVDADSGTPVWTYDGLEYARFPTTADGSVYASDIETGALHSVDAETGAKRWSFEIGSERAEAGFISFSPLGVEEGTVYVVSMYFETDAVLHALDAATGEERWNRTIGRSLTHALTVADGVVYCGLRQGFKSYFAAMDADTGTTLWKLKTAEDIHGQVSSIAVSGDTVYFGTESGVLRAADTAGGALRWDYRTASDDDEWTDPPVVADGVVYAGVKNQYPATNDGPGRAYAFDARSGKRLWSHETTYSTSPVALTGGAVAFGDESGRLHTLNPRTGESWGEVPLTDESDPQLVVSGSRAYFDGGDGRLHAAEISLN
jgi:outer membrane protein assembly factor BamB